MLKKMFLKVTNKIALVLYTNVLNKKYFFEFNVNMYRCVLHGLGILNYRNSKESGEEFFLGKYLRGLPHSPQIFDVGAHAGEYVLSCLAVRADCIVNAFEPHPVTYLRLQKALQGTNVRTYALGLGDINGEVALYDSGTGTELASTFKDVIVDLKKDANPSETTIAIQRLDSFAQKNSVQNIDLLKIDTEGCELLVLNGATETLAAGIVKCIQFEFNAMNVVSRVFLRDFIKLLPGYSFFRLLPDGLVELKYTPAECEIFAFQNIVAIRNELKSSLVD